MSQPTQEFPNGFLDCLPVQIAAEQSGDVRLYMSALFYACVDGQGHCLTPQARFPIQAGSCFFMTSGQSHRIESDKGIAFVLLQIAQYSFPSNLFGDHDIAQLLEWLARRALEGDHSIPLEDEGLTRFHKHLVDLESEATRTYRGRNAMLKARSFLALAQLLQAIDVPAQLDIEMPYASSLGRIADVLTHIQSHYAKRIAVKDMATLAGLSRSHFHAAFRKATGCSLIEYVNRYRLMRAKGDVLRTEIPMATIAKTHGFGNASRFSTVHRQLYGTTPNEARRRYRADHLTSNLQRFGGIDTD